MFAEERQEQIVRLVEQKGSVRVKELSEQFQVTEDCIRKDLTLLEKRGLLKKSYGGAIKRRVNTHDLHVSQRRDKNIEAKQKIAARAMELIKDGDMVFLDISTASLELAKLLVRSNMDITVVSNMIDIMLEFMTPTNVRFIFIGGCFSRGRDGFVGSYTDRRIGEFRFDLAFLLDGEPSFMEVKGVTLERQGIAAFPDAPTERGVKHVDELTALARKGVPCFLLLVIQMKGVVGFRPNWETHPKFGHALERAKKAGVRILAYDCLVTEGSMQIHAPIPIIL